MLTIVSLLFLIYFLATVWYFQKVHARLRAYEQDWIQINRIADHNVDGDVVIHIKHFNKH